MEKKILLTTILFLICIATKLISQKCFEFSGTVTFKGGPYPGTTLPVPSDGKIFRTAQGCANEIARYKLDEGGISKKVFSLNCQPCKGSNEEIDFPKRLEDNNSSKPKTPKKPNVNIDQAQAIASAKNNNKAQMVTLGVAAAGLLADAIRNKKNKKEEKNWKELLLEKQQQYREEQAIKKEIDNTQALSGLIDETHEPTSSTHNFTNFDSDNDGKVDALVEKTADGGKDIYVDTDNDGVADRVAHIDKAGEATYSRLDDTKNPVYMTSTSHWENFQKTQSGKVGDNGYMTIVKPSNKKSDEFDYDSDKKTYFINGMDNSYDYAVKSAQLLSNTINSPVVQIYSATDGAINDLSKAMNYRINTSSGDPTTDNLARSLTYDLLADREVTLYAHSRGAAATYQIANNLSVAFATAGLENKMHNLTIVTVGGFSPPAGSSWPSGINVEQIKHPNDPVPKLGGNGTLDGLPSLDTDKVHSFETYIHEIDNYNRNRRKKNK